MHNHHYNKTLIDYARELRTESVSLAEKFIWKSLLSRGKSGVKFKRQRPIDRFIVDFFAQEIELIIEIDGNSHHQKPEYDAYRMKRLESLGYTFLRFSEGEVLHQIEDVEIQVIHAVHVLRNRD